MKNDGIKAITLRPNQFELAILDALKEYTGERTYSKAIMRSSMEFEQWRRRAEVAENEAAVLWAKIDELCNLARQKNDADKRMYAAMSETIKETERATHRVTERLVEAAQAPLRAAERLAEAAQAPQRAARRIAEATQAPQRVAGILKDSKQRISEHVEGISMRLVEALIKSTHPAAKGLNETGISPLVEALSKSTHPAAEGLNETGISPLVEALSKSTHPAAQGLSDSRERTHSTSKLVEVFSEDTIHEGYDEQGSVTARSSSSANHNNDLDYPLNEEN